ncbi:MAG TPA: hypothetical protein VFY13_09085 [Luteolibacter sp.]|nr:hypothetical protein [Luteolibacter sp.]
MTSDSSKDFQKRLSQWVASQGFWFQLRYSMVTEGAGGRVVFHLVRLGTRLLVFFLLLAALVWFALYKRTQSKDFADSLAAGIQRKLGAEDLQLRGLSYSTGKLEIARVAAEGRDGTFFETLEMNGLRCNMGLLEGWIGQWDTGVVSIIRLDAEIRAGSDNEDSSAKIAEVIFDQAGKAQINALEVSHVHLRWGYSSRTRGSIVDSTLKAQRNKDGWRVTLKGGTLCQNWLKDLEIVSLVVYCTPHGLRFEEAVFSQGQGRVVMSGAQLTAGARPRIEGNVRVDHLSLAKILPDVAAKMIEGSISGDFRIEGSTNTAQGIGLKGTVILQDGDCITLRDSIPLLMALSVMDYSRNYHRLDFKEGSFDLKTAAGSMELGSLDMRSHNTGGLVALQGGFKVRLPTEEEIQHALDAGIADKDSPLHDPAQFQGVNLSSLIGDQDFTLQRAAIEARHQLEGQNHPGEFTIFDRLKLTMEMRSEQVKAAARIASVLQYEGHLEISVPGDAFERAGDLRLIYPAEPATGRIGIGVPIKGFLHEITREQAQMIYDKGRRL